MKPGPSATALEDEDAYMPPIEAAARWSDDGIAYTDAKSAIILELPASTGGSLRP